MNFLAIVAALAIEWLLAPARDALLLPARALRRRWPWPALWASPVGVLAMILLPTLVVALAQVWLQRAPVPATVFAALVLFACLGPRDLSRDLRRLSRALREGDREEQERLWRILRGGPEPVAARTTVLGALFIQSHETLFGVLVWASVAGPAGAVFYRMASRFPHVLSPEDGRGFRIGTWIHNVAAFVPSRLTCLLFALAGSMDAALRAWAHVNSQDTPALQRGWVLLADTASAASAMEPEDHLLEHTRLEEALREVMRMQRRALLIGLAADAVLVAGLWLG